MEDRGCCGRGGGVVRCGQTKSGNERVASAFCSAAQGELVHVGGEDDDEEGIFYSELELLDVWRRGGLG